MTLLDCAVLMMEFFIAFAMDRDRFDSMTVQSFSQAKEKVVELKAGLQLLQEFLERAETTINALSDLKGEVEGVEEKDSPRLTPRLTGTPPTIVDRVLHILREKDRPMWPKEIVTVYEDKGWPRPDDRRKFYVSISSTLIYLAKTRHQLKKTDEGYWFAD